MKTVYQCTGGRFSNVKVVGFSIGKNIQNKWLVLIFRINIHPCGIILTQLS